jgi:hypothetical protein
VKSLEGLYLTSFDASRIKVSRKVQEFYASISEDKALETALITVIAVPIVVATPVEDL